MRTQWRCVGISAWRAYVAAQFARWNRRAQFVGRPLLDIGRGFPAYFFVRLGQVYVTAELGDQRAAVCIMQMRVDQSFALVDVDHATARVLVQPSYVAVIIVEEFLCAHGTILLQCSAAQMQFR